VVFAPQAAFFYRDAPVKRATKTTESSGRRRAAARELRPPANPRLFTTPQAKSIKQEICAVGRKLWLRQFVDGNGGNISYRIGPNEVICTPTMVSKFDLTPADLCMVDLDGNQIAGTKPATSEILLHLEIFKAVPEARAAVHCHPPHATAYAVTGLVPANLVIPEFEIFVGKVAIAPYETPGTDAFARTVLPFVKQHNTVLLTNHGVVCWSDTVTGAEWNCEILDTYCTILAFAAQLGAPLLRIPEQKATDLLARKKRMGLPDIRFAGGAGKVDSPASERTPARPAGRRKAAQERDVRFTPAEIEALVRRVTREVLGEMGAQ
jgi:L-fuculose-phosphate aldolase